MFLGVERNKGHFTYGRESLGRDALPVSRYLKYCPVEKKIDLLLTTKTRGKKKRY